MPATIHVIARFIAKPGKEDQLKAVLIAMMPPTRRELACYQYDLLNNATDTREFCFVERWDGDSALDQHVASKHFKTGMTDLEDLVEGPPDIRRYTLV
jgi:quinol monooxygenase YgiN